MNRNIFYLGGNPERSPSANLIIVSGMIDTVSDGSSSSMSSADKFSSSMSSSSRAESVSSFSRS